MEENFHDSDIDEEVVHDYFQGIQINDFCLLIKIDLLIIL